MQKRDLIEKIKRLTKAMYLKLFRINDTPLKIALGFGLGVFLGIMPGLGPVLALALAFLFRVNRISAFLGSILFNTWFGLIAILWAAKIGSFVMGLDYHAVYDKWVALIKKFKWEKLFDPSLYEILVPISVGYVIISFIFAAIATAIVYIIVLYKKKKNLVTNK